ncbi:MAG: asparagine synthase (glutamine-hydrolyzing) [Deltaproteobacteria bacterium]|nr:asparagine synthase (glutamine-hydrolyzing) [Deltaproteobacteria bacterium]
MCGIVGYVQRERDLETVHLMMKRVRHRGPDGAGEWFSEREGWHVGLGHRRLSVIDLKGGHQPMANEDGSLVITYNGEIYNFAALRSRLEEQQHGFSTKSDTEVVIHHFEQHGPSGLTDLNGMFAFAIWNQDTGELTLARDRAGIKPLYFAALPEGGILFASELSALLAHPACPTKLSVEGLAQYFFSDYGRPPDTVIDGISRLAPGEYIVWRDGVISEGRRFWNLREARPRAPLMGQGELAFELWDCLSRAVKRQLVADVPVGVFLSGGIDSSVVAALAQAHSARPIRTFSIAFEDSGFDESAHARAVAGFLKTQHTEEVLTESLLLTTIDAALSALDEPLGDPSFLPTYLLSKLAAQHVKVVLGGDGGDELWAGYPTYRAHGYALLYQNIPSVLRKLLIDKAVARLPVNDGYQSFEWKAKRFALRWDNDLLARHLRWMSSTDLPDLKLAVPQLREPARAERDQLAFASDQLNSLLALDFTTYLPGSVLTKVDRASMAHGLEVRPPLLDNELIDYAFGLPSRFKLRDGTGKYLFKLAARSHLPENIIHRPKKGFAIPLARWLRGPLATRLNGILEDSPVWNAGILKRNTFVAWQRSHQSRREDRSRPLWALLVLDAWMRKNLPS